MNWEKLLQEFGTTENLAPLYRSALAGVHDSEFEDQLSNYLDRHDQLPTPSELRELCDPEPGCGGAHW
jgi:hypothetical protein